MSAVPQPVVSITCLFRFRSVCGIAAMGEFTTLGAVTGLTRNDGRLDRGEDM